MSIESMMPSNYLILCRPLLPLLLLCFWLKSIIASCKLLHQLLLIVAYISMTEGKLILHLHCTFPKALSIANSVLTNYKYPSPQSMTERPKDVCFPPFSLKGSCHLTKLNFPFILCGWVYLISLQAHKSYASSCCLSGCSGQLCPFPNQVGRFGTNLGQSQHMQSFVSSPCLPSTS